MPNLDTNVFIPKLSDYGIDPRTGFLPCPTPLKRLGDSYFEPWESLVDDISHHLVAWNLRTKVEKLPQLDESRLKGEREYQRAFLVLSLLSHAYVWGAKGESVVDTLPKCLSIPWINVSKYLGLRPISCHAALVYYNFKLLDPYGPHDLSNLATLHTISGGMDESWFYLVTVAIEADGAPAIPAMLDAMMAVVDHDIIKMEQSLKIIAKCIEQMTKTLMRMPENCDPYIFYHRVRIYFAGWSNMKDLPLGLTYEGDENQIERMFLEEGEIEAVSEGFDINKIQPKKYPGGSAAQSTLIHALDVFLGVSHQPTSSSVVSPTGSAEKKINFLHDMRYHMPLKYRQFLKDLSKAPSVHKFIESQLHSSSDKKFSGVKDAFNTCIANLKVFRDKHIQIVTRYIVIQARRAAEVGQEQVEGTGYHGMGPSALKVIRLQNDDSPTKQDALVSNDGLSLVASKGPSTDNRGTGGTEIMPFLKQSRDETFSAILQ